MEEPIVYQSRREQYTFVNLCLPVLGGVEFYGCVTCLNMSKDRQTRIQSSLKRHRCSSSRKVADHNKSELIVATTKVGRNIERVIVPNRQTAPRRPNGYTYTVDIKLISCVCREMQDGARRSRWEAEVAAKLDNSSGRVDSRGINPVRDPNPVCIQMIDCLLKSLVADQ
jgi:hypothetical protein